MDFFFGFCGNGGREKRMNKVLSIFKMRNTLKVRSLSTRPWEICPGRSGRIFLQEVRIVRERFLLSYHRLVERGLSSTESSELFQFLSWNSGSFKMGYVCFFGLEFCIAGRVMESLIYRVVGSSFAAICSSSSTPPLPYNVPSHAALVPSHSAFL